MRKKLFISLIVLVILLTSMLTGCNKEEPKVIVYLGDSIAEGIAGISPLGEREKYAYYGVLGIRNDYIYRNRAVSGHTSESMLKVIKQEDYDARAINTLLKTADIIEISILGNDLLLNGLSEIILAQATGELTLIDNILAYAKSNFAEIYNTLRGYNKNAAIIIQTLYNPAFEDTILIDEATKNELTKLGFTSADYRHFGGLVIDKLNNIFRDFLTENPNAFHLVEVNAEFNRIYLEDNNKGKGLIFVDDVHPTDEGHAVMADLIQEKLEELGLANKKQAVKKYKELRKEQLNRMYSTTVDVKTVCRSIDKAKTCSEITDIYFRAIEDIVPVYY